MLAALTITSGLAQTPSNPAPLEICTAEDYAIYSAALNEVFGKQTKQLVLIDQTSTGVPPGMAGWTRSMRKAQPLLAEFPKEAREDFDARNKTYAKIELDKIKTSFAITLIAPDNASKLFQGGNWASFHDTYQSDSITLVSRPGLDSDRTHALLYAGSSCGSLCGGGVLIFLTKENGQWKVTNKANIWMS
jgi:hypothetical protein